MPKDTSRGKATSNSENIKPTALEVIKLHLSEGICQSVGRSVGRLVGRSVDWSVRQSVTKKFCEIYF